MEQQLSPKAQNSPLYSDDLAPISVTKRTWSVWNLAALWVGMAVCVPTYMLASSMIKSGLSWQAALIIIGLANLVITIPMVLNGEAGVRYGIPFPVIGRAAFGTSGIHIAAFLRAIVACGWFGIQTWIGGLAIYSIFNALTGNVDAPGLSIGEFVSFGIFWCINIYFIWKGTESIKWLEDYSAPILLFIGLLLIAWGYREVGSADVILSQSSQLGKNSVVLETSSVLRLETLKNATGINKATQFQLTAPSQSGSVQTFQWENLPPDGHIDLAPLLVRTDDPAKIKVQFRNAAQQTSSIVSASLQSQQSTQTWWTYLLWFTAMIGFWATMSISISDITRFAKSQKDQVYGQLLGLPGTMMFYSFVGIFVTCAAVLAFQDVLIVEDAPWDPVSLVAKFNQPIIVVFAQIALLIATLSTNIAANVIAPAYAFSNLLPRQISFRMGGVIAGIIGIISCPWWLMKSISDILLLISGLLGPILGILLCDYFVVRRRQLALDELYWVDGQYCYNNGWHLPAIVAMLVGVGVAIIGNFVPALSFLFTLSWFSGFISAFLVYWILAKRPANDQNR
jgi:cytosine/uracil/thiamine/allantoin permease